MSNKGEEFPEDRLKILEFEFKNYRTPRSRPGEAVKEAIMICIEYEIPSPDWIHDGMYYLKRDFFQDQADQLEEAYKTGNLGALKEMVYWCDHENQPLPKWAANGLYDAVNALTTDNKLKLKSWRDWFKKYRQNMKDFEIYDTIKEARGEYLELGDDRKPVAWSDVYEVAGAIIENQPPENLEISENTIKKAYQRVINGLEENPLQYKILHTFQFRKPREKLLFNPKLWQWINETLKAGNPKKSRKRK
ncbi:hypothetical protein ACQE3D_15670 [Methylomonas sp. MS20]|uniref:hypothetical protein n=1 Tax=unclassified Methylomonas TaxID=2608980 RepID=UPI0028A2F69E|nr:hypothetical protein [Methylomonas sp. MV1]MDT4331191.1 hypothetical protein [Methylomonas sp. MV1]